MGDLPQETFTMGKHGKAINIRTTMRAEGPCSIPEGCAPPGEKTCENKFLVKRWGDLVDVIKKLLNAEMVEVHLEKQIRTDLPSTLVKWEIGGFQVVFSSEKGGTEILRFGRPRVDTEQELHINQWRYEWWEHKEHHPTFGAILQEDEEYSITTTYGSKDKCPHMNRVRAQNKIICGDCKLVLEHRDSPIMHSEVITENSFERSKEEALKHYRLFTEVVAEVNEEWFNENEEVFKNINLWFKDWPQRGKRWPFPVRGGGPRRPIGRDKLLLKCPECKKEWERFVSYQPISTRGVHIDYDVKETKCPNPNCEKFIRPKVKVRPWLEVDSPHAVLQVDDFLRKPIEEKMKGEEYSVPPLSINFKIDKPKPATETEREARQTTEIEVLPRPAQLEEVAKELKKHLEVLEQGGVEPFFKVRGYADSSASCSYNLKLSKRRADWVVDKLMSARTEEHTYVKGKASYELSNTPVTEVNEVEGTSSGVTKSFVKDVDYRFIRDSVEWLGGGEHPDEETNFTVKYVWARGLKLPESIDTVGCGKVFADGARRREEDRVVIIELCAEEKSSEKSSEETAS